MGKDLDSPLGLKLVTFPGCCRGCKELGGRGYPSGNGWDGGTGEGGKQVEVSGVP